MRESSKLKINLAILLYVVIAMLLSAGSSPLINSAGKDSSAFILMGRAMLGGKIMYRDVFDHKGLYLYFINALAAMMSGKSLAGLFVIECVFMFLCARIIYALVSAHANGGSPFAGMQVFLMFALINMIFSAGNITEEYGLLFQVLSVYILVKDGEEFSCLHMFLQGLCAGAVIFLRPNIAMMWGGIALVAGYELLKRKKFGRLAGNIAAGISGVAAAAVPAVIYAVMSGAAGDMMFGMFGYNFMYMGAERAGIFFPVLLLRRIISSLMISTPQHLVIYLVISAVIVSCVLMLKKYRGAGRTKYYFAMLFMTLLSVALSGRLYGHYYESLVPFCLPLAYFAASFVRPEKFRRAFAVLCVLTLLFGFKIPDSMRLFFGKRVISIEGFVKSNAPYYSENERVLVSHNNAVFYNALGVLPQEKYFYIPANAYDVFPEPRDSQAASIISGVNDVIIVQFPKGSRDIYPETGRSGEILRTLDSQYDLLHHDNYMNISMYGKKRK